MSGLDQDKLELRVELRFTAYYVVIVVLIFLVGLAIYALGLPNNAIIQQAPYYPILGTSLLGIMAACFRLYCFSGLSLLEETDLSLVLRVSRTSSISICAASAVVLAVVDCAILVATIGFPILLWPALGNWALLIGVLVYLCSIVIDLWILRYIESYGVPTDE